MRRINLQDVPVETWSSPQGKFAGSSKSISVALGRVNRAERVSEAHPFDLELTTLQPGQSPCPYHAHSAQWELHLVISGMGRVRSAAGWEPIGPGDAFIFPPGEAHQIENSGEKDLVFYLIANDPVGETCHYPDTDKWGLPHTLNGDILKGAAVDYYLGEE